jgi:PQQ-dependent dehydrogenase (s-GDH family)
MPRHFFLTVFVALLLLSTFSGRSATQERFAFRVVATGLKGPWEITLGPDDRLWMTERLSGRISRVNPANGTVTPAAVVPDVYFGTSWHEGLLGMALHPDLLKGVGRDWVYVAYTYDADPGPALSRKLRVRRYTYNAANGTLAEPMTVIDNLPAHDDHGGGRMVIGPDGKLYLSRGDQGSNWLANYCNANHAQDLPTAAQVTSRDWSTYQGKILRMNLDGSIPADNPTINGVRSHIYTYGHRNPQGLVFGPNGLLYESEHGQGTDDEVNLIQASQNYGWPFIAGYRDDKGYVYNVWAQSAPTPCSQLKFDEFGSPVSVPKLKESDWKGVFQPPLRAFFTPDANYNPQAAGATSTIAPSSLDIYTSSAIPGWANSLLLPGMTRGRVYRMKLSADGRTVVGANEEVFRTQNRYRDSAISRDGRTFYFASDPEGLGKVMDLSGNSVMTYANPGAILEFKYQP